MRPNLMNCTLGFGGALLLSLALAGCGGDDQQSAQQGGNQQQKPPTKAEVMEVEAHDVSLSKEYPAQIRSNREVTVMGRVEGILEARHYREGSMVEKGDELFTIEQAPYEATVKQRQADVQSAKAEVYRAQRDAERYQRLYNQNSISQQQRDQAQADLRTAQAAQAQAQAALDSAQIDLSYTEVNAPVSGMISLSEINVGNLVQPPQELATITPLDPIEVRFSLPADDAFALRQQRQQGDADQANVAVLTAPGTESASRDALQLRGRLDFLGSRVDESTSTVQAEAVFQNDDQIFLPGQFVRVTLPNMMRYDVYAVPSIAVTEGLKGPQVFVLDDEGKTETRFVSLGEIAGDWQIITEGLNPGDRVVVSAIGSISAGDQIDAQPFSGKVPKPQNNAGENPSQEPDAKGGEGVAGAQRDAQEANGGQNGAN
ncbi:efflux RND transporter periplasmic adaptor subunit [Salinicola sp. LHM]|uniref:efflux RND transporter periplasmic adaptor subunit n=1 Tax=Salinicola TaxID=404432 RepID=UPI001FC924FD|nr:MULTISPECIES: efflux RND transporter periplasmic adaptor subunit [Salinicola]MDF3918889.1 efflux RND transporter periplasmic adaptor subunit [Salinicola salarius]WQH34087.1 efflux RND transporter periplasmic adaptor subunit [Salinicola sp. LHM]